MNKRGKIIVNVIDTGDGLLISDADIERYGLQYDKHYEGEFLPDGRYMITGHREPMTNHNNASETSGELLGVAEWIVHEYPKVADILTSTAETIKRLVAERDAARLAAQQNHTHGTEFLNRAITAEAAEKELWGLSSKISRAIGSVRFMDPPDGGDVSLPEQVNRMRVALEAAEKRIAELEAQYQQAREDRLRHIDYSCDLQRIIEDLCHGRNIREPKTSAVHHYNMAVAYYERKS